MEYEDPGFDGNLTELVQIENLPESIVLSKDSSSTSSADVRLLNPECLEGAKRSISISTQLMLLQWGEQVFDKPAILQIFPLAKYTAQKNKGNA